LSASAETLNIAYKRPIKVSSLYEPTTGQASYANDGDTRGEWQYCWNSAKQKESWLRVDFGYQKHVMSGMVIGQTVDYHLWKLHSWKIYVGDYADSPFDNEECFEEFREGDGMFECDQKGRYMFFYAESDSDYYTILCELMAFESKNIALGKEGYAYSNYYTEWNINNPIRSKELYRDVTRNGTCLAIKNENSYNRTGSAFYAVDLGYSTIVHGIAFASSKYDRDNRPHVLRKVMIRVGDDPNPFNNQPCSEQEHLDVTDHAFV